MISSSFGSKPGSGLAEAGTPAAPAFVKMALKSSQDFFLARKLFSAAFRFAGSASNLETHSEGSSTSDENSTARQAASGRRAHHKCRVEGCPCRMDFSRAASRLMSSSGSATSMSFLR